MVASEKEIIIYEINKNYRMVKAGGKNCSLLFKNRNNDLLASLEGCFDVFSNILVAPGYELTKLEKGYLLSFIRAKKFKISKEVAEELDVSIVKYLDGREEYLSEKQLKKRIVKGIDFAKVYVGKINALSIDIADDSTDCSYYFANADIKKIVVGENCTVNVDLRDNRHVEKLIIGERFSGSVNLARSAIESVFVANNCRCNMNISDSKRCFNLQIADIYSGNLHISNCCLYALNIGYYSYADIIMTNNIIKKDIEIGDSFRGDVYLSNQNVDSVKIGDDCKGWIKISNQSKNVGVDKLAIGNDFAGSVNLSGDGSVEKIEIGYKNNGKIDAAYSNLKKIKVGKYYSGLIRLEKSMVEEVNLEYGASGSLVLNDCVNLKSVKLHENNNVKLECNLPVQNSEKFSNFTLYGYAKTKDKGIKFPIMDKIYANFYNWF